MRVFYALRLPTELRPAAGALARSVAREAGGRPVPEENLHLTLVFVGDVATEVLPMLERIGASVARDHPGVEGARAQRSRTQLARGSDINLDRLGAFPRTRVAWLAPSSPPAWLCTLVDALERALDAEGIAFDSRTFHPHLTLARSCRDRVPARAATAIDWRCDAFELVRSPRGTAGGRYETLARWSLAA